MSDAPKFLEAVPVSRIFLSLTNPRHEEYESEAQAIARLCEKEAVYPLARDIVKNGLNPLERLALLPAKKGVKTTLNYNAAEGNRRICALKLLNDPELAPANLRKAFEKLADQWASPITKVSAVVFDNIESVNLWLDRIHNGLQGGIGRKDWNPEQKQRFDGGSKNKAAQSLLDYAEAEGIITPEERIGKLTTVQRFLGNEIFREMIGFDQDNPDDIARTRPKTEFDILVNKFIRDLVAKEVNSRMNKDDIRGYARSIASLPGVTSTRIISEAISPLTDKTSKSTRRKKPKKLDKIKHVRYEEEIFVALKQLGNEKLSSLYHSICSIDLDPHTPIVAIGIWSFFETLTACAGRNDGASFDSFLNKDRLVKYGITDNIKFMRGPIERIRDCGNTTKHHKVAALFNGDQLNNDMLTLKKVILGCIVGAADKSL